MLNRRESGLLLHVSSLPSPYGIGDAGPEARRFVDFLAASRQRYWQILPLNPTSAGHDNSPYMSISAFAMNPLFISPDLLVTSGLLGPEDLEHRPVFPEGTVDFPAVERFKGRLFDRALENFTAGRGNCAGFSAFCQENAWWLSGFALFVALHRRYGDLPWCRWPEEIRHREPEALARAAAELAPICEREQFLQYLIHTQWQGLHGYCTERGIRIVGDMPIYVDYDSADLWVHPELFRLDASLSPVAVAGVPPDYFSETGQLWRNPLYDWDVHKKTGFAWWLRRLERVLSVTDLVRIDHFRGLVAYWEVPAGAEDARGGRWVPAPAREFLAAVKARFPQMPVIAEDLGIITPDVRDIMAEYSLPGMRVLLFAFTADPSDNPNAPHSMPPDVLLYTGTHDNAPIRGWYESGSSGEERQRVAAYLGPGADGDTLPGMLIRQAMISPAGITILPVQDILGLGIGARMNTPGTPDGNWRWRLIPGQLTGETAHWLSIMTRIYGRG